MTDRERDVLYQPWRRCLDRHGVGRDKTAGGPEQSRSEFIAAVTACRRLEPLPPLPLDPANPQARAFVGRVVDCLRRKGYQARAAFRDSAYTGFPGREYWGIAYTPETVSLRVRTDADEHRCQQNAVR